MPLPAPLQGLHSTMSSEGEPEVTVPDWRTSRAGAKVRAALWLVAVVGEGGIFTKSALRDAFPGVAQIDRRARDLRSDGWEIATYKEDRSLSPDQQRLVRVGGRVWSPGYRRTTTSLSDKQRNLVLAADNFACTSCGVTAGDAYPDDPLRTAKLMVKNIGGTDPRHVTACSRCAVAPGSRAHAEEVLAALQALPRDSQILALDWVRRDSRSWSAAESWWAAYRALSASERAELRAAVLQGREA